MSSLKLLHSGGNGVIISAPSSNPAANRTITLNDTYAGDGSFVTANSSGNVGLGTASPPSTLSVEQSSSNVAADLHATGSGRGSQIKFHNDHGLAYVGQAGDTTGDFIVYNGSDSDMLFSTNASERMRISSGGQLLIGGTTSPNTFNGVGGVSNLVVAGSSSDTNITNNSGAAITISNTDGTANNTAGLHFAREDTDGAPHYAGASIVAQFADAMNTGEYPKTGLFFLTSSTNNAAPSQKMHINDVGDLRVGRVYSNTTSGGANVRVQSDGLMQRDTSSRRYKNTIADATHGLADLNKLRPVTYKGNNDGDTVFGGLIAEEVHDAGLTEFVDYDSDNKPDALKYGNMVSLCIKAIQELSAKVETLETKVAALEGA